MISHFVELSFVARLLLKKSYAVSISEPYLKCPLLLGMVNSQCPEPQATGPPKRCAGCGGKIADRFLLYSMDCYWHSRCLKCSCCQAQLGDLGTSCYTRQGMILCRDDYIRMFGSSGACNACGQSIPASELVMKTQGNVYHLKCFACATCRTRLVPGDRFHYVNGSLFCEHDRPAGPGPLTAHRGTLGDGSLPSHPLAPHTLADQKVSPHHFHLRH
ncbi:unnamed protein product [Lampetra fluviatilis]